MKLDLNTLTKKTFELTLLDESIININKPTKEFLIEIENFKATATQVSFEKSFDLMEEMCLKVINNNAEGKKFTNKYLEKTKVDYTVQMAIFNGYFEFVQDVMRNPN